jgi:hypothetical protein
LGKGKNIRRCMGKGENVQGKGRKRINTEKIEIKRIK